MPKVIKKKKEWLEVKVSESLRINTTDGGEIHITHYGIVLDQMVISKSEAKKLSKALEDITNA